MRNSKNVIIALVLIVFCFSCVQELIPPLEIKDCVFVKDGIILYFSESPKENSFTNNVLFLEDDNVISGDIIFNDKIVKIIFENGIQENKNYRVNISSDLEDKKGCSLLQDYVFEHSTRKENISPFIKKISPAGSVQEETKEIEIIFSEPIDMKSFHKAFSVTPSFDFLCDYNAKTNCVKVIPVEPLKQNERYLIKISTELLDINNNQLKNEYSAYFDYFINTDIPIHHVNIIEENGVTKINPDNVIELSREKSLQFEWNKKIFLDGVKDLIFIEPYVPFEIKNNEQTEKDFVINFDFTGMWGKSFELKLLKGIKDSFGNTTKEDYVYKLNYCDENNRPILFNCALLKNGSTYKIVRSENQYDSIIFDILTFPATSGNNCVETELFFLFLVSNNSAGIDRFSAMENISLTTSNNCCDILIKTLEVLTEESDSLKKIKTEHPSIFNLTENQGKLSIVKCILDVENADKKGLITFEIKQQICDDLKNTMEKDIFCKVNKL